MKDIRLEHLAELLKQHGGRKIDLAKALSKPPAQISQWFNGVRKISEESARDIERRIHKPPGWMDRPRDGAALSLARAHAVAEEPASYDWPFPRIDARAVRRLNSQQVHDLETAMLTIAGQLGVRISKHKAA